MILLDTVRMVVEMQLGKKVTLLMLAIVMLLQGSLTAFATESTSDIYAEEEYGDEFDDEWDDSYGDFADDYIPDGWYDPEYGTVETDELPANDELPADDELLADDELPADVEAEDNEFEDIHADEIIETSERSANHQISTIRQTGVTRRTATFRRGPGAGYATIRSVSGNTNLRITGRTGSWYRVVVSGTTGWLRRSAVARTRQNAVVITNNAHVRAGRGTGYRSLTRLPRGQRVTVRRRTGNWSRINIHGHTGWIRNSDLRTTNAMRPGRTTVDNVAVHTRPRSNSNVRLTLPRHAPVMIVQRTTDGWSQIRLHRHRRTVHGWVRTSQVENRVHSRRLIRNGALRGGPGTNFSRIRTIPGNTSVTVRSRSGNWYHVHVNIGGHRHYGWLHRNNLPGIVRTLTTAEALSYLALVNRDFRLSSNFSPNDLRIVNVNSMHGSHRMRGTAARHAEDMFHEAGRAGHTLLAISGYRSYATQTVVHNNAINAMGIEAAMRVSARPGHSEHQLGLALDLSTHGLGGALSPNFSSTPEGRWVRNNAHRFGFIIRYPQNREADTGFVYEPWHIRFVGVDAATQIFNRGMILEEFWGQ